MEVVPDGADVLPYSVIAPQKMRLPGHHTAAVCMHACMHVLCRAAGQDHVVGTSAQQQQRTSTA